MELQLEKCIKIDNKVVIIEDQLPDNRNHLRPLYDFIDQQNPIKLKKILDAYLLSFSDKNLTELIDSVGVSLERKNIVKTAESGMFFKREKYIPTVEAVNYIIDMIKSEFLETDFFSDELIILVALLNQSKLINLYFSKFEQEELNNKLKKISQTDNGKVVATSTNYINSVLLLGGLSSF